MDARVGGGYTMSFTKQYDRAVAEHYAAFRPPLHRREPLLVRSGWGEVFSAGHHRQAGGAEDVWKLSAKIAIGKERAVHAACS